MLKHLFLALLAMSLFACGSDDGGSSSASPDAVIRKLDGGKPLFYNQAHTQCAQGSNPYLETHNAINFHFAGKLTAINLKFENRAYQAIPEIKNDETHYNFVEGTKHHQVIKSVTKLFKNDEGEVVSVESEENQKVGKIVQICEEQKIQRDSGEHVALNIVTALDQSFKALKAIDELNDLSPTTVYTHPEVIESVEIYDANTRQLKSVESETMTDNAFYWNNGIYFIPHSAEYLEMLRVRKMTHVNFWETSFVASHEFGHKVFEHNFPDGAKRQSFIEAARGRNCFNNHWRKKKSSSNKGARVLTKEEILGAFNEGFADMFAFYSLESGLSSLKNVPWFERERDVDSMIDEDFKRKVYDKKVADAYFLDRELNYRTDADAKFQDSHTIGAIFAANINFFMDSVGVTSKSQKLKVTMKWLASLQKNYESDQKLTEYAFLFKVIERYVDEVKSVLGVQTLTAEQKAFLVKGFPHYQFEIMQKL